MASEMMGALMELCQEKHIDELYLLDRLEQSLAKSYADVLHLPFGARHEPGEEYLVRHLIEDPHEAEQKQRPGVT